MHTCFHHRVTENAERDGAYHTVDGFTHSVAIVAVRLSIACVSLPSLVEPHERRGSLGAGGLTWNAIRSFRFSSPWRKDSRSSSSKRSPRRRTYSGNTSAPRPRERGGPARKTRLSAANSTPAPRSARSRGATDARPAPSP